MRNGGGSFCVMILGSFSKSLPTTFDCEIMEWVCCARLQAM